MSMATLSEALHHNKHQDVKEQDLTPNPSTTSGQELQRNSQGTEPSEEPGVHPYKIQW